MTRNTMLTDVCNQVRLSAYHEASQRLRDSDLAAKIADGVWQSCVASLDPVLSNYVVAKAVDYIRHHVPNPPDKLFRILTEDETRYYDSPVERDSAADTVAQESGQDVACEFWSPANPRDDLNRGWACDRIATAQRGRLADEYLSALVRVRSVSGALSHRAELAEQGSLPYSHVDGYRTGGYLIALEHALDVAGRLLADLGYSAAPCTGDSTGVNPSVEMP